MTTVLHLVAACLLALPQPSSDPVLEGVVEDAFEGADEDLPWSTHVVTLSNLTGRDLDVVVTLTRPPSTRIARPTAIARHGSVRLQFFAPNIWAFGDTDAECHVRDANGHLLWRRSFKIDYSRRWVGTPVTTYLSMTGGPAGAPRGVGTPVTCRETHFPQRVIGLRGFAFILMRDTRFENMIPAQMDALHEWVASGGTLILCPGANPRWLASEGVRRFARVELGASETRTLPGDDTRFAFHRILNGRAIARGDIAFEHALGAGRVVVCAVDLESPPFDRWIGRDGLLRDILERPTAKPGLPPFSASQFAGPATPTRCRPSSSCSGWPSSSSGSSGRRTGWRCGARAGRSSSS